MNRSVSEKEDSTSRLSHLDPPPLFIERRSLMQLEHSHNRLSSNLEETKEINVKKQNGKGLMQKRSSVLMKTPASKAKIDIRYTPI